METETRVFDRLVQFDERSLGFGIAEIVPAQEPRAKYWTPGLITDQGSEGACVGHGWTGELLASPKPFKPTFERANEFAHGIYKRAQVLDPWPGEDYSGTSVLAGAKAIQELGYFEQYRWAFSVEQVRDAIIAEGPVVIGVNWYDGMYYTEPNGLVNVSGQRVGGHCLVLTGYSPRARLQGVKGYVEGFRWKNSWGTSYGKNGIGFIRIEDLDRLLHEQGEACIPVNRKRVRF
jgi:hypothetical protein